MKFPVFMFLMLSLLASASGQSEMTALRARAQAAYAIDPYSGETKQLYEALRRLSPEDTEAESILDEIRALEQVRLNEARLAPALRDLVLPRFELRGDSVFAALETLSSAVKRASHGTQTVTFGVPIRTVAFDRCPPPTTLLNIPFRRALEAILATPVNDDNLSIPGLSLPGKNPSELKLRAIFDHHIVNIVPIDFQSALERDKPVDDHHLANGLAELVLPQVNLHEATLTEALDYLRSAVEAVSYGTRTLNIFAPSIITNAEELRITVSLMNIPVAEALRYVTGLANTKYRFYRNVVIVQSIDQP